MNKLILGAGKQFQREKQLMIPISLNIGTTIYPKFPSLSNQILHFCEKKIGRFLKLGRVSCHRQWRF